jgi:ATP-binding protein involved in chromosome partitioning
VENMSYMPLPGGGVADIFGRGGAEKAAQEWNLPFLGALPLYPELRSNSDTGQPHANFTGQPELKQALETIVQNTAAQVSVRNLQAPTPELTIT